MAKPKIRGIATRGQLDHFHLEVAGAFCGFVKQKLEIRPAGGAGGWEDVLIGKHVFFELVPSDGGYFEIMHTEHGDDVLLPFAAQNFTNTPIWTAWSEEWVKAESLGKKRSTWELVEFSLRFAVGSSGKQKTLLLRAEWDNPSQRGGLSAQPHWHIDPSLLDVGFWSPKPPALEGSLQELPVGSVTIDSLGAEPNRTAFWSISELHLGMAGWTAALESPKCWQLLVDFEDLAKSIEWLAKVLSYASTEFDRLKPSTG